MASERLDCTCPYCHRKLVAKVNVHVVMNNFDCFCGATAQAYKARVFVKSDPAFWHISWESPRFVVKTPIPKIEPEWYAGA